MSKATSTTNPAKSGYGVLKGQGAYWRMFTGSVMSRFGDSVDALAYAWLVFQLTGSASWSALVLGINTLPSVLFAPLLAPLVDRMNQKALIIITNLGRSAIVAATALLYLAGWLQPWMLLAGTFLTSTLEAVGQPAWMAFYPRIVPEDCYTAAKSLSQSSSQIAQLIGTAAAGGILATLGVGGALLIDGATFVFDAFMISTIRPHSKATASAGGEADTEAKISSRQYFTDLKAGFTYLFSLPVVLLTCVLAGVLNLLLLPGNALSAAYVALLGKGPELLSLINGTMMLGMLLGTAVYPYIAPRVRRWKIFVFGTPVLGLVYLGLSFLVHIQTSWLLYVVLCALGFALGVSIGLLNICVNLAFMEHVAPEYMARTGSVMSATSLSLMPIGSFAIAGLVKFISVPTFLLIFGLLIVAMGPVMLRLKTLREL